MLISELLNITPATPVRERVPTKIRETATDISEATPLIPTTTKVRLKEFLVLQELTGMLKKTLQK